MHANINPSHPARIRTYKAQDSAAVHELFRVGLLAGVVPDSDLGHDLAHIEQTYLDEGDSHLWVAEIDGAVVGMVGVLQARDHLAEIRRLRVAPAWQSTEVAAQLVETAVEHCRKHGYLKVVLDTRFETEQATHLFSRFGFRFARTRHLHGKVVPEYYIDLYSSKPGHGDAHGHGGQAQRHVGA